MHSTFQKMGIRVDFRVGRLRLEIILYADRMKRIHASGRLSQCTIPLFDSGKASTYWTTVDQSKRLIQLNVSSVSSYASGKAINPSL